MRLDDRTNGDGPRRRIRVVANETVAGRALRNAIAVRAEGAEIRVVSPALNSPLRHWFSDEDGARERARERLERSLDALAREGIHATGEIGDANPLQAIADALATFPAHELVIAAHPPLRSNWLEKGVLRAREIFGLPVVHVVVDLEREAAASTDARTVEAFAFTRRRGARGVYRTEASCS
ncbi:MAG: hypothetical protein M3265_03320 [Actinomycetota bacterium]|nr:hypothetical protein [Actinomycetota bacterium]